MITLRTYTEGSVVVIDVIQNDRYFFASDYPRVQFFLDFNNLISIILRGQKANWCHVTYIKVCKIKNLNVVTLRQ